MVQTKNLMDVADVGATQLKQYINNTCSKQKYINMPFEKNDPNINRNGREKGSSNKYTKQIKEAFGMLLEGNLDNLSIWLSQVAADDPKAALDIMMKMSERFVPRLSSTDITSDGEQILQNIKFDFGPPIDSDERDSTEEVS
jgi:hypothetical protein